MKQRAGKLLVLAILLGAPAAGAQVIPVTVPRGAFRIELGGEFRNADSRYHGGETEDLARSFTAVPLGSTFFPGLALGEMAIGTITGNPAYQVNLGRSTANGLRNIGTATIGLSYGVTSRLTLTATVPVVRTRMQLAFRLDSAGADAGLNPNDPVLGTPAGRAQTSAFFAEFDAALATLAANIAAGVYDGNPQQRAQADAALVAGTTLRGAFGQVYNDPESPFVPTATSATGTAVVDTVTALQASFASLGVTGFTTGPALAEMPLSADDFNNLVTSPGGPIRGFPLDEATVNLLGDIEGGVSWLLVDRWYAGGVPGGYRAALSATVRFPTGELDRTDNFLDVGTGTGHVAARVGATVDFGRGRLGSRVTAFYQHEFAAELEQRVAGPFTPVPPASTLAAVRRTPGARLDLAVMPFFRLGNTLALTAGVRYQNRGRDEVTLRGDPVPGIEPGLLADRTGWSLTSATGGVTYMSPAAMGLAGEGFPVEASWTVEGPLSGSGGIVAKERIMRIQFRMYMRL